MSCFGGGEAKLFLAEVTVERLRLTECKYKEEFNCQPSPVVKIKFLDFPTFVVSQSSAAPAVEADTYDEVEGVIYNAGKACLFARKPRDLVSDMQLQPLKVGVFRGCETFPVADGSIALSGCLCDQVAMVDNDPQHLPKPYQLNGVYNLKDPGKDHAGSVKLFFRLTLFGSYVITHYELLETSCVFKNDDSEEWRITRADEPDEESDDSEDEVTRKQFSISAGTVLASMVGERPKDAK